MYLTGTPTVALKTSMGACCASCAKKPLGATETPSALPMAVGIVGSVAGAVVGYKRTGSVGWALVWSLLGGFAGVPIALAQKKG